MRSLIINGLSMAMCLLIWSYSMATEDSTAKYLPAINALSLHPEPTIIPTYWSHLQSQSITLSKEEWTAAEQWVQDYLAFTEGGLDTIPSQQGGGSIGGLLDNEIELIQKARAVIDKVKVAGNFITRLTGQDLVQLPIGLHQKMGSVAYTMGISSIELHPTHAQLEIFLEIDAPNLAVPLLFSATDVKFSATGGILPGATLSLLGNIPIEIVPNRSALVLMRGERNAHGEITGGTFVSIDCDGFQALGLDGIVEFSRSWLKPAVDNGQNKVSGRIATVISDWEDILLEIDLDDFVINKLEDVIWRVDRAVFDFSDWRNASGIKFPINGYDPPLSDERWQGFYIKEFSVEIPRKLTGVDSSLLIQGKDVIIDNMGFTGQALATPILSLENGDLGGWAFSIDTFGISVIANQVESVAFNGLVHVPLAKAKENEENQTLSARDCLRYDAYMQQNNDYFFSVSPDRTLAVDIWQAEVGFDSCSYLDIAQVEDNFIITAHLHGYATIDNQQSSSIGIRADSIHFQGVELSNQAPYFHPGYWSFPSISPNFGAFALTLEDIGLYPSNEQGTSVELGFGALISLSPSNNMGMTACGGFAFQGELVQNNGRQRWQYTGMRVDDVFVNVSAPGFGVQGGLSFYEDDPKFGQGFRGMVAAWFRGVNDPGGGLPLNSTNNTSCLANIPDASWGITAMGQFGTVDDFDYFIVDALIDLGNGIPILSEAVKLKSFGGGVYNRMSREEDTAAALEDAMERPALVIPPLGSSLSGLQYYPDRSAGLGIKATVLLAAKKEKAFNANANFEIIFNSSGGLSQISFYGTAKFMQEISFDPPAFEENPEFPPPAIASMSAYLALDMNFEEWELDASMAVFLNAGAGVIRGSGPNDKMGWANLYLSKNNGWHLKAGEPAMEKRNGITIGIPKVAENLVKLNCYLMMGTHEIPGIPPIESELMARIMQYDQNSTSVGSRPSAVSQGGGFAFGATLDINTGERTFLIFYGQFALSLGFDVAIQDFGSAQCAGGGSIGINGWYASGQAWAGIGAAVGIKVRLFGKPRKFEVAQIAAGAILQAKLPNPFWAKGTIGAQYNLLNGLIKGQWSFDLTIGNECEIIGASDPGIVQVIESIEPKQGLDAVDVSVTPTVNFLIPVEETYRFTDLNGEQETYRVRLDQEESFMLLNGTRIRGNFIVSTDHLSAQFIPEQILPGTSTADFIVSVYFEEKRSNGWYPIEENGAVVIERDTLTFTTGPALEYIPDQNLVASYPLNGQYNFYTNENELGKGYILLARAQPDLLVQIPTGIRHELWLTKSQEFSFLTFPAEINTAGNAIHYNFPRGALEHDQVYQLKMVQWNEETSEHQVLYEWYFRTSKYSSIAEKLAQFSSLPLGGRGGTIARGTLDEPFGAEELGKGSYPRQLKITADVGGAWYQQAAIQQMYDGFPHTVNGCVNTAEVALMQHEHSDDLSKSIHLDQQIDVPIIDKAIFDHPINLPTFGSSEFYLNYLPPNVIQQLYDQLSADVESILTAGTAYFDTDNTQVFAGGLVNDFTSDTPNENTGPFTLEQLGQQCPSLLPLIQFSQQDLSNLYPGNYPIEIEYKFPGLDSYGSKVNLLLEKPDPTQ
ncbi:MAG: hypothetical protein HRU41_34205 [Saprospiraceae bacterium]|nr:hypothetical protein [Saprospiraceae bacterium]